MSTRQVALYLNLNLPHMVEKYKHLPIDGIGLLRTETVIAGYVKQHPLKILESGRRAFYVDTLTKVFGLVAREMYPRPVVIRFSDQASDEFRLLDGGNIFEQAEPNPAMGLRGTARYLVQRHIPVFQMECSAIRSALKTYDNIWLMLPFCRTPTEVERCLKALREEGIERNDSLRIWLMAEVPSVALMIDDFCRLEIDGFSIGSNDLTQLVLGADRDNPLLAEFSYFDDGNQAVLNAMRLIVDGAKRANLTCSICGDAPSNSSSLVENLVRWGITSISVAPSAVHKVYDLLSRIA